MRVDAHQHYWQIGRFAYPWLTPATPILYRDYLPTDLIPQLAQQEIAATVVVQADGSLAETDWLLELAANEPTIAGIVGWSDLTDPACVARLAELANHPRFKGVRPTLPNDADWSALRQGMQVLATHRLTCDLLCRPATLPRLAKLIAAYPDVRFVLDHLAGQPIVPEMVASWRTAMGPFAAQDNVVLKLSGYSTNRGPEPRGPLPLGDYVAAALDLFGADRLLFGSDWPVSTQATDYAATVELLERALPPLSATEHAAIWGGTARTIYRLDLPEQADVMGKHDA
jgi:L-fuconolactonase